MLKIIFDEKISFPQSYYFIIFISILLILTAIGGFISPEFNKYAYWPLSFEDNRDTTVSSFAALILAFIFLLAIVRLFVKGPLVDLTPANSNSAIRPERQLHSLEKSIIDHISALKINSSLNLTIGISGSSIGVIVLAVTIFFET